jgi:hypothetical protein
MDTIESSLQLEAGGVQPPIGGQLLALVDSLQSGTLSQAQRETVHELRTGILAFVTQEVDVV